MAIRRLLVLLGLTLTVAGCMAFELEVSSNADTTTNSQKSVKKYETVHGSMYGFLWHNYNEQKCNDGALAQVEFHYNWFQLLTSAVTLGVYVPQTVEWWCDDPSLKNDAKEPGLNPNDE